MQVGCMCWLRDTDCESYSRAITLEVIIDMTVDFAAGDSHQRLRGGGDGARRSGALPARGPHPRGASFGPMLTQVTHSGQNAQYHRPDITPAAAWDDDQNACCAACVWSNE